MQTQVHLGGEQAFRLQHALLVYGDGRRSFVTLHDPVAADDGTAPALGPGRPLGTAFLKVLAGRLGHSVPADVLPPEVLVRTSEVTVWWRRPSVAPLFYAAKATGLGDLSGRPVPHPPLVFRATAQGLWVRALAEGARPTATTPVFAAPYYNVGKTGSVCLGSMRRPATRGLEALAQWETSFFESEFTHQLPGAVLTRHPGGFAALWRELAAAVAASPAAPPTFPVEALQRAGKQTLGAFVTSDQGGDW